MIHRAAMGNFTAPSMRPGGFFELFASFLAFYFPHLSCLRPFLVAGLFHVVECGDDINNCEEQVILDTSKYYLQLFQPVTLLMLLRAAWSSWQGFHGRL
jgi:hypothetical protein